MCFRLAHSTCPAVKHVYVGFTPTCLSISTRPRSHVDNYCRPPSAPGWQTVQACSLRLRKPITKPKRIPRTAYGSRYPLVTAARRFITQLHVTGCRDCQGGLTRCKASRPVSAASCPATRHVGGHLRYLQIPPVAIVNGCRTG